MDDVKVTSLGDFAAAKAKMPAKAPDPQLVASAEELLARCRSGEVSGFVLFGSTKGGLATCQAGDGNIGDIFAAFEAWKLNVLMGRRE